MKRTLCPRFLSGRAGVEIACVAILLLACGFAADKTPPNAPREPLPKEKVNAAPQVPPDAANYADLSKLVLESPTKNLLAGRTVPSPAAPGSAFVNPKVEPGKVHWHKTFADACRGAQQSRKPVLLFQMMGNLDERFC